MSKAQRILIVDDEPDIRELLEITLSRMDLQTTSAENYQSALEVLQKQEFDLCLTDLKLPDGDGIDLVRYIQTLHYPLPVAVFTAHGNTDTAITAMKAGAYDFVSKPVNLEQLRALVQSALEVKAISSDTKQKQVPSFVGESPTTKRLLNQIRKLSQSQAPIYISGESGSGKEVVARSIHYQGPKAGGPFIPVNCGAIPAELMESEFFGHKKGAFTGAHRDKTGLFQAADGGTLFLDEVADLPLDMQVKLLRAIQEKAIRPIGEQREVPINVRILSATHKNLQAEVESGRFRSDLYYRINVIEIPVPTLRDRKEDIEPLCQFFIERIAKNFGGVTPVLSKDAMKSLKSYHFPGNVRELENILERAFTLCENSVIVEDDLFLNTDKNSSFATKLTHSTHRLGNESLDAYLIEIEKEIILEALDKNRWNKTAAAEQLGISFRSLRYRLKKLGLEDD
ncbi:MAG: sigma-54 dependent transcriptional regulator [Cellvibrionaceae bacterium]|nr:sigma-54 dependent transcriptional regulator [Cellvibrionaceae bacterium]